VKTPKKLLASAGAVLLAGVGLTVGVGGSAGAATCYGGAVKFTKPEKARYAPEDTWFKTTNRCNDINLKLDGARSLPGRSVKVCFRGAPCQTGYTYARPGSWTVIATNVKDGTQFKFLFEKSQLATGSYAS